MPHKGVVEMEENGSAEELREPEEHRLEHRC